MSEKIERTINGSIATDHYYDSDGKHLKSIQVNLPDPALLQEQAAKVLAAGWSLRDKVTPIDDYFYFVQLAKAGKDILKDSDIATETVTVPSTSGSYEASLDDINLILAGLETIRSNSLKVGLGELDFEDIEAPLKLG